MPRHPLPVACLIVLCTSAAARAQLLTSEPVAFGGGHVTIGVVWLLTLLVLDLRGRLGVQDAAKVEVAGLYWHFVDVVWIVIFTVVYLIK